MSVTDPHDPSARSRGVARSAEPRVGRLAVRVEGSGPTVLLLHGQPGSAADWAVVVEELRADHRVIVPDRPGYGASPGPAAGIVANADILVGLLDDLEVGAVTVVGHSWAGLVALAMAQRHPERVDGLVLVASPAPRSRIGLADRLLATRLLGSLFAWAAFAAGGRAVATGGVQARLARRFGAEAAASIAASAATWRRRRVRASFLVEQRALLTELPALAAGLSDITVPTTVMSGTNDRVVSPADSRALAKAIAGAQLVEIPGAGHLLPARAPGALSAAVAAITRAQTSSPGPTSPSGNPRR